MSILAYLKIGGAIGLVLLLAAFVVVLKDRNRLAAADKAHRACEASVAGNKGAQPWGTVCSPAIAAVAASADQAKLCDAGLSTSPVGVPVVCSIPVKALAADRDARKGEVANRDALLAKARAEQAAAVARAEARGRTAADRQAVAAATIAAAPRDAAGLMTLDAAALCRLAGCPTTGEQR